MADELALRFYPIGQISTRASTLGPKDNSAPPYMRLNPNKLMEVSLSDFAAIDIIVGIITIVFLEAYDAIIQEKQQQSRKNNTKKNKRGGNKKNKQQDVEKISSSSRQ